MASKKLVRPSTTKIKYLSKSMLMPMPKSKSRSKPNHKPKPQVRAPWQRKRKGKRPDRSSPLMRNMLKPLLPPREVSAKPGKGSRRNKESRLHHKEQPQRHNFIDVGKPQRLSMRKLPHNIQLLNNGAPEQAAHPEHPVVFLTKDQPTKLTRRKQRLLREQKRLREMSPERPLSPIRAANRNAKLGKLPAKPLMDFFSHMGQRTQSLPPPPPTQKQRKEAQRLAAAEALALTETAPRKPIEVPLTNRLPIIDFISTKEFASMLMASPRQQRPRHTL